MNKVWVFTSNNARMLWVTDAELPAYQARTDVAINPPLGDVLGLAPHYWKLSAGKILPLSGVEQALRDSEITKNGADNGRKTIPNKIAPPSNVRVYLVAAFAIGGIALAILLIKLGYL